MPKIIPIEDLKNTSTFSKLCHNTNEPVFITKNGYGDMVIMSMETYERTIFTNGIYRKLAHGEQSIKAGKTMDALESLHKIREEFGL